MREGGASNMAAVKNKVDSNHNKYLKEVTLWPFLSRTKNGSFKVSSVIFWTEKCTVMDWFVVFYTMEHLSSFFK